MKRQFVSTLKSVGLVDIHNCTTSLAKVARHGYPAQASFLPRYRVPTRIRLRDGINYEEKGIEGETEW